MIEMRRDKTAATTPLRAKRRLPSWLRCGLHGVVAGFLIVIGITAIQGTLGGNFHTVIPGLIYRSGQPSSQDLQELIEQRHIRTVINLRGCCAPSDWYLDECRVTHKFNVAQEDISLCANRLPATTEIRRLIEVLDHCEYPVLFHCFRGADRTGLASTIAQLLKPGVGLDEACRQLSIRYGHVAIGKTANIDRFFDLYREWLAERGWEHSPEAFRRWAIDGYCPGECRCQMELLRAPKNVPCGKPIALTMRAHNTSIKPWRLCPDSNAGIHANFTLYDSKNAPVSEGRAGMFDANVAPGESIDLTLALPAVLKPGTYRLVADMVDEQHCSFYQTGSDLLEWELEVREQEVATGR